MEEIVEGPSERGELIIWALKVEPAVEVGGGDLLGRGCDGAERAEESAGEPPGGGKRDGYDDQDDDRGAGVELVNGCGVLGDRAVPAGSARLAVPEEEVPRLEEDAGANKQRGENGEEDAGVEERDLDAKSWPANMEGGESVRGVHCPAPMR